MKVIKKCLAVLLLNIHQRDVRALQKYVYQTYFKWLFEGLKTEVYFRLVSVTTIQSKYVQFQGNKSDLRRIIFRK